MSTIRLIYILLHVLEIWMLCCSWKENVPDKKNRQGILKASLWAFVPLCVFV